jgi:hypothetical protein
MASPASEVACEMGPGAGAFRKPRRWLAPALLVACTLLLHGHGLTFGFWLDDHNHLELCRQYGYAGLARGNRFDWTGRIAHVWWAHAETGWAYFRPLTVALRVTLLRLFGLNPLPFHAVHLTLCTLSVLLLYRLLGCCGWGRAAAFTAGLFFTLHPTHAFTASWLANDGQVLVGLWTVLALGLMLRSGRAEHRRPGVLAGVFLCYVLAMLSRENGLMLGPMLVLFDSLRARRLLPSWRRCVLYGGLALTGLAYLWVRHQCLESAPLPRSPYFHWPTEPGFFAWLPYKLLNDMLCLPLGLPFVPMTEVAWLQDRPLTTAAGVLALVALALLFVIPLWRSRAAWGLLAGMVLAAAPTLLVFSAAYNFYVVCAGWAVLLALWARRFWPVRPRLVGATLAALVGLYLAGWWAGTWTLQAAAAAERCVRQDVLATQPARYPPGTQLFFIDLPFFAAEVGPALRLEASRPDLAVYPLTFAPELFAPRQRVLMEQEDEHTLVLRRSAGEWFRGPFGEVVQLGWFGASRGDLPVGPLPLHPAAGQLPFRVEVVAADAEGVSALRFVFDRLLDDPHYRFFVGSPRHCAQLAHFHDLAEEERDPRQDFERLTRAQMAFDRLGRLLRKWPL